MNLNDISSGESIIVDAKIVVYAIQHVSGQCEELLYRCAEDEIKCCLPAHILAEIMHQLMIIEARENGWIAGANPARQLTAKPELVKRLVKYEELMHDILSVGFQIEPLMPNDFLTAISIQNRYGLLTNDALFVSIAKRLHIRALVSTDKVFERVTDYVVYTPDDLSL
ncbi:MAG: hypothetical protein Kow0042_31940 [Calditrichia bacterium]